MPLRTLCDESAQFCRRRCSICAAEVLNFGRRIQSLFFNEAETLEDTENRNTEITVEQYKRKQKTGCFDKLPENIETYTVEHELSEEERKCP